MGACTSSNPDDGVEGNMNPQKASKAVDRKIKRDQRAANKMVKVLLLGAGGSGKSTLFRQMQIIYGSGFTKEQSMSFAGPIFETVVESFILLSKMSKVCGKDVDEANVERRDQVERLGQNATLKVGEFTPELAADLEQLWKDPGIQATFAMRNYFPLSENCAYFAERVAEIGKPDYVPTPTDIMCCRVTTTGMVEAKFKLGTDNILNIYDVGGQRNERKKWIHCFEHVTAILFVASLSAYNQLIVEDNRTNALVEGLNLFEDICNSHWFEETSIILFLNKADIYKDKYQQVPLSDHFPTYTGGLDYQKGIDWIRKQYVQRNENDNRRIYVHVTTATDTELITKILGDVRDTIWDQALRAANLV